MAFDKIKIFIMENMHRMDSMVVGAFTSKKEFIGAYEKEFNVSTKDMDKEEKEHYSDLKSNLYDRNKDPLSEPMLIAIENPNKIISYPQKIFRDKYWIEKIEKDKYGGVFVDNDTLKQVKEMEPIIEQAENYKSLKGRLIKLAKYLEGDDARAMV